MDPKVNEYLKPWQLTNEALNQIVQIFFDDMNKGLKKSTNEAAVLKMFPSYVTRLPTGNETGDYLALDLGGTNFRVLLATFANKKCELKCEKFQISDELMKGPGNQLFEFIAECLANFAIKYGIQDQKLHLGFTFSFPCLQESLLKTRLQRWTKGFTCSGVVGEEISQLLQQAIHKQAKGDIEIITVSNDTVSTLISAAFYHPNCKVGVIVGTGINVSYLESLKNIEMANQDELPKDLPTHMIVNTECGAFGVDGSLEFIRTKYDRILDAQSLHPTGQLFEKMISGMYLGEMVRLALVPMVQDGLIFKEKNCDLLQTKYSFLPEYVSACEKDVGDNIETTKKILEENMKIINPSSEDCLCVKKACESVSSRAAHLLACALVAIMKQIGEQDIAVGYDGSLIKYHAHFRDIVISKIKELLPEQRFELVEAEDGSGKGVAIIVAAAVA